MHHLSTGWLFTVMEWKDTCFVVTNVGTKSHVGSTTVDINEKVICPVIELGE